MNKRKKTYGGSCHGCGAYDVVSCTCAPKVKELATASNNRSEEICHWKETDEMWETGCGNAFNLETGTPSDNEMKYCPYCGKLLTVR